MADLTQIYGPFYGGLLHKQGMDTQGAAMQNESLRGTLGLLSQMARAQEQNELIKQQVEIAKLKATKEAELQAVQMPIYDMIRQRMQGGTAAPQAPLGSLPGINPGSASVDQMIGAASAQQRAPAAGILAQGSMLPPDVLQAMSLVQMPGAGGAIQAGKLAQDLRAFDELSAAQRADINLRTKAHELDVQKVLVDLAKWNGLSAVEQFNVKSRLAELADKGVDVNALLRQAAPQAAPQPAPQAPQPAPQVPPSGGQLQFPSDGRAKGSAAEALQREAGTLGDMSSEGALRGAMGAPAPAGAPAAPRGGMSPQQERELAAKRAEEEPKQTMAFRSNVAELDRLIQTAREVRNHPGLAGNYGVSGAFFNVPGGQSANAKALLDTLTTQIGLNTLSTMRQSSPTGGAVGNVTEREWPRLENALTALQRSQNFDQVTKGLDRLIEIATQNKANITEAYTMAYPSRRERLLPPEGAATESAAPTGFKVIRQR